ncbi:MAG: hypothetical protein WDW38_007170 [Sanguina aurantia]
MQAEGSQTCAQATAAPVEAALPTTDWERTRLLNIQKNVDMQKHIMSSAAAAAAAAGAAGAAAADARAVVTMEPGAAVTEGAVTQPKAAQADPEQGAGTGLKRCRRSPGATGEQEWAAPKSRRRKQESPDAATATRSLFTSGPPGGGGVGGGLLCMGAAAAEGTGQGACAGVAGEPTVQLRRAKAVVDYKEGSDSD